MASQHPQYQVPGPSGYYNQPHHQHQNPQAVPQYAYPHQMPIFVPQQHYNFNRPPPHGTVNGSGAPTSPRSGHMNGTPSGRGGYGRGGNTTYYPHQPQHQHLQHQHQHQHHLHPHHTSPHQHQHYGPPQIHAPQPTHHLPHKYIPIPVQTPYSPSHAYPYPSYPPSQAWSSHLQGRSQPHQHLPPQTRQDLSPLSPLVKLQVTAPGEPDSSPAYTPPLPRHENNDQLIEPVIFAEQSPPVENGFQIIQPDNLPESEGKSDSPQAASLKVPTTQPVVNQTLAPTVDLELPPSTSHLVVSTTTPVNEPSFSTKVMTEMNFNTSPNATSDEDSTVSAVAPKWAIWSRRPGDPRLAPGIIISPHARPPPHIVAEAVSTETPPPSPPPASNAVLVPPASVKKEATTAQIEPDKTDSLPTTTSSDHVSLASSKSETNQEISVSSSSSIPAPEAPEVNKGDGAQIIISLPVKEVKLPTPSTTPIPSSSAPASSSTPLLSTSPSTLAVPVPVAKKSWASLLKPSGSSAVPTKGSLPTSQVVGFSIPAIPTTPPSLPVSVSQRSALLRLLGGYGAPLPGHAATVMTQNKAKANVVVNGKLKNPTSIVPNQSTFDEGPPKIRARGLINSGNSCYANAVLQALIFCPPFWTLFTSIGKILYEDGWSSGSGTAVKEGALGAPLVEATVRLVREFVDGKTRGGGVFGPGMREVKGKGKGKEVVLDAREGEGEEEWDAFDSFVPMYVYDALKEKKRFDHMRGGHQEDAEEFLGFFLDTLEEELLGIVQALSPSSVSVESNTKTEGPVEEKEEEAPVEDGWLEVGRRNRMVVTRTVKGAESPVSRVFGGKFRSTLRAPGQKDSVMVEDWRSLRLDIQRDTITTIQDALLSISQPSAVQIASSARPQTTLNASQQILVEALPPILVLHLKRFLYDAQVGGVVKVARHVRFGPDLEIPGEILVGGSSGPRKGGSGVRYGLLSVVYHHGVSAGGGHYTIDTFRGSQEGWARIDDEVVSSVRPEDVLVGEGEERCAYLLFYRLLGRS